MFTVEEFKPILTTQTTKSMLTKILEDESSKENNGRSSPRTVTGIHSPLTFNANLSFFGLPYVDYPSKDYYEIVGSLVAGVRDKLAYLKEINPKAFSALERNYNLEQVLNLRYVRQNNVPIVFKNLSYAIVGSLIDGVREKLACLKEINPEAFSTLETNYNLEQHLNLRNVLQATDLEPIKNLIREIEAYLANDAAKSLGCSS